MSRDNNPLDQETVNRSWRRFTRDHMKRRRFMLQMAGASAAAGLAGCQAQEDNTDTPGNGDDTTDTPEQNISGTSFTFWTSTHAQARTARLAEENLLNQFRSDTGAKPNVSWEGLAGPAYSSWVQPYQNEKYPVLQEVEVSQAFGTFVAGGWVEPIEDFFDLLDQETKDAVSWIFDIQKQQYAGIDRYGVPGDKVWGMPWMFMVTAPDVFNVKHLEEAGYSPEVGGDAIPFQSQEHLVEVGTTLRDNVEGSVGYQQLGAEDITDANIYQIITGLHGDKGTFITDDWSDTNVDSQEWIDVFQWYKDLHYEHDLGVKNTVQLSDEAVIPLLVDGSASASTLASTNRAELQVQAPDRVGNGEWQWSVPMAPNHKEGRGFVRMPSLYITKPPEGANESQYRRKQEAAFELVKYFLSKDFQRTLFDDFGYMPVREDVWPEIMSEDPDNLKTTLAEMADLTSYAWSAHPQSIPLQYGDTKDFFSQAIHDKKPVDEALKDAAEYIRGILAESG